LATGYSLLSKNVAKLDGQIPPPENAYDEPKGIPKGTPGQPGYPRNNHYRNIAQQKNGVSPHTRFARMGVRKMNLGTPPVAD
jgi:hypothetical protein